MIFTGFYLYIPGGYIAGFLNHQQYVKNMVEIWCCLCHHQPSRELRRFHLPLPFIRKIRRNIFLGTDQGMVGTYQENSLVFEGLILSVVISPYQTPPIRVKKKNHFSPFSLVLRHETPKGLHVLWVPTRFRWIIRVALGHVVAMSEALPFERWLHTRYRRSQYLRRCRYTCITIYHIYIYTQWSYI